jgi:SHS family sialic acid transporter-like MFS transporter
MQSELPGDPVWPSAPAEMAGADRSEGGPSSRSPQQAGASGPLAAREGGVGRLGGTLVLTTAFLGWMLAGTQMSITPLVSRSATISFLWPEQTTPLQEGQKTIVAQWFARYNAAFLLGAAAGGLLFGWLGDRAGRARAMGLSIVCYSLFSGAAYFAESPWVMLACRFASCLGVGGMWPNGIALVSEVLVKVPRTVLAGLIGTAANVGQVLMAIAAYYVEITPASWRWVMLVGASPVLVGAVVLAAVPESPRWLAERLWPRPGSGPVREVFRPPLLGVTLLGIVLGGIPLLGGWGSGNWLVPWADEVSGTADPQLKAMTQGQRSFGGAVSSLLGGWVASRLGRRFSYFLISLGSLATSAYIFNYLSPRDSSFGWWALVLGVVSGFYFGWLPLCLPELFPTRVRSTGAGVTFNFGRIGAACGVMLNMPLVALFSGDYGRVGAVTSLIYALGLVVAWLVPRPRADDLA